MTKEEQYSVLRDKLANASCSEYQLNILKQHFREKVDSDRRSDRIINLMGLIKILEKRDVIGPNNVNPVKYIAELLENYDIGDFIRNFITRTNPTIAVEKNINADNDHVRVLPRTSPDLIARVYDLISMEIGHKWKDFARALKIPEGFIDQLEYKHMHNISEMVRQIITYHKEQCDPRYWRYELGKALTKARRVDLSRAVERIFAMHSSG